MENHTQAVHTLLDMLADAEKGVLKDFQEISVIGHRLVHGGEKFTGSVVINDEVIEAMTECNPANLVGGGSVPQTDAGHSDGRCV